MRRYAENKEVRWIPYIFSGMAGILLLLWCFGLIGTTVKEIVWIICILTVLVFLFILFTKTVNTIYSKLEKLADMLDTSDEEERQQQRIYYESEEGAMAVLCNELWKQEQRLQHQIKLREQDAFVQNDFMENMAHQLKTTVAALQIRLEMAGLTSDAEKRAKSLEQCMYHSERLTADIDHVLEAARLQAGKVNMSYETCQMQDVLQEVVTQLVPIAEQKKVHLQVEHTGEHKVSVDIYWIQQALKNIIKNGIEHTPENSVIRITETDYASTKCILIEDEGKGFAKGDLNHVFDRFYSQKKRSQGYRIGLNMAKNIVEMHHGILTAGNRKNGGAWFKIALPILVGSASYEKE